MAINKHYKMINAAKEEMNYEEFPYDHPPVCAFMCGETHKDLIYFYWKVLSWIVFFELMSIFKETWCILHSYLIRLAFELTSLEI